MTVGGCNGFGRYEIREVRGERSGTDPKRIKEFEVRQTE